MVKEYNIILGRSAWRQAEIRGYYEDKVRIDPPSPTDDFGRKLITSQLEVMEKLDVAAIDITVRREI